MGLTPFLSLETGVYFNILVSISVLHLCSNVCRI
jgi:hypothetical protein